MTTKETVETPEEEPKPENEAKGLRAQNDSLRKEVRELKAGKRDDTIAKLGLQVDSGIGLVLVEQFDKGDITLDTIAESATKYGHVVPDAQPPAHPQAAQIAQGQAALDNIGQTAGSIAPPTEQDRMVKAESDKDFNTTIAMKSAQLGEMLRNK